QAMLRILGTVRFRFDFLRAGCVTALDPDRDRSRLPIRRGFVTPRHVPVRACVATLDADDQALFFVFLRGFVLWWDRFVSLHARRDVVPGFGGAQRAADFLRALPVRHRV